MVAAIVGEIQEEFIVSTLKKTLMLIYCNNCRIQLFLTSVIVLHKARAHRSPGIFVSVPRYLGSSTTFVAQDHTVTAYVLVTVVLYLLADHHF